MSTTQGHGDSYSVTIGYSNPSLFPDLDEEPTPHPITACNARGAKWKASRLVGRAALRGHWRRTQKGWRRDSTRGPVNLTPAAGRDTTRRTDEA